jgi:hypothetical protein
MTLHLLTFCGVIASACAQVPPEIAGELNSVSWTERASAFQTLAQDVNRSPEVNAALVALLVKEDEIVRAAFLDGPGASEKYGEAYGEYVSLVGETVQKIADDQPETAGVWSALLRMPYNPDSMFGRWLASHGDKTANFLLSTAQRNDHYFQKWDALTVLAQIVSYENNSSTVHRLNQSDVRVIDATVRAGLDDTDDLVRYTAVMALAIMGTRDDVARLEKIAASDPQVITSGGLSGTEIRFPIREAAKDAASRLKKRLAAQQ